MKKFKIYVIYSVLALCILIFLLISQINNLEKKQVIASPEYPKGHARGGGSVLCTLTEGFKKALGLSDEIEIPQSLIIQDYGFTAEETESGMARVSFGLEIKNPNADFIACNASVRISYYDKDENLIVSTEEVLPVIFAESIQGFAMNTSLSALPEKVEAEPVTEDAFFVPKNTCDLKDGFEILYSETLMVGDTPAICGEIENKNPEDCGQILVTAVFRDKNGKIKGGTSAMVRHLTAGDTLPFSIFAENLQTLRNQASPLGDSCQIFDLTDGGTSAANQVQLSYTLTASCWYQYFY